MLQPLKAIWASAGFKCPAPQELDAALRQKLGRPQKHRLILHRAWTGDNREPFGRERCLAGLNDRRRPFSLLRLAGVPLSVLRRSLALETAVPLLSVAVVAAGMGFLAASLFLRSQLDYALSPPGLGYYLTVLAGLAVSLAVVGSTLPLLRRLTGPETARNE